MQVRGELGPECPPPEPGPRGGREPGSAPASGTRPGQVPPPVPRGVAALSRPGARRQGASPGRSSSPALPREAWFRRARSSWRRDPVGAVRGRPRRPRPARGRRARPCPLLEEAPGPPRRRDPVGPPPDPPVAPTRHPGPLPAHRAAPIRHRVAPSPGPLREADSLAGAGWHPLPGDGAEGFLASVRRGVRKNGRILAVAVSQTSPRCIKGAGSSGGRNARCAARPAPGAPPLPKEDTAQ